MHVLRRPGAEDAELAAKAAQGDAEAFGSLFELHHRGIYDFVVRIVGERELAADIVQTTFTKAWEQLRAGRTIVYLQPWLYSVARNAAIDELRAGTRIIRLDPLAEEDPRDAYVSVDRTALDDPEEAYYDQEMVDLVWNSARALGPSDYALLDMHVRRELTVDELSGVLGLRKGAVYTRLSRLKDSLEDSVVSELILRNGRRDCAELDALARDLDIVSVTPESHKQIQRHIRKCEICQENKRRLASPVALFRVLVPVPLAPAITEGIWRSLPAGPFAPGPGAAEYAGPSPRGRSAARTLATPDRLVLLGVAALTIVVITQFVGGADLRDPDDVHSTSHRLGIASTDRVIDIAWSRQENVSGYSVAWSEGSVDLPDAEPDLSGMSTGTSSPVLTDGKWFFHLRTRGVTEDWTSTVHLGPFVIEDDSSTTTESENEADERTDEVLGRRIEVTPTFDPATFPIPLQTIRPSPDGSDGGPEEGNQPPVPSPSPSPQPSPSTPTATPTPTVTATATPTPTVTPTPTPTPTPTLGPPVIAPTPSPSPQPSPEPSPTPSEPEPTPTEPSPTPSEQPSVTPTEPTPTRTGEPQPTPSVTHDPEPTPTKTEQPEPTPTITKTPKPKPTKTESPPGAERISFGIVVAISHEVSGLA